MSAPVDTVFEIAADLSQWPRILPHYRWVKFVERSPSRNVVKMAARRKWIPIQWTSEQEIDRERKEVRFHHLKAFTKGMRVVWTFTPTGDGVHVRIRHDLDSHLPIIGAFFAERIIGKYFVGYVAAQTLKHMKRYVERNDGA